MRKQKPEFVAADNRPSLYLAGMLEWAHVTIQQQIIQSLFMTCRTHDRQTEQDPNISAWKRDVQHDKDAGEEVNLEREHDSVGD